MTRSRFRFVSALLAMLSIGLMGCSSVSSLGDDPASAEVAVAGLFDSSTAHSLNMTYDQADYEAMIDTLAETGEKTWIEVSVTIDGVTYEQVGARLKGNSSLRGLSGGFEGGGPGGNPPEGFEPVGRVGGEVGPDQASASADEPEGLPWLIRLDHFVDGQNHQGYVDVVVRSNESQTSLNEAVALDLLDEAGLASQDAASVRFSVNGSETTLRLMIEHPSDDAWQDANFEAAGALYKAESTGDWSYRGDDQGAYDEVFDQEGGKKVTDLTPLIEFLQFINESDDSTFATELPERFDVNGFATYLAMMELVDNFDSIDGPGNNAYIWWDAESEMFMIVPWDLNLAFSDGGFGGRPGGDFGPGAGGRPGFEPPADAELPDGFEPPEGLERGPGGGGLGEENPLVERFHDTPEFEALYQAKLEELRSELFDSGRAEAILAEWTEVMIGQAADIVDVATIEQESEAIAQSLGGA